MPRVKDAAEAGNTATAEQPIPSPTPTKRRPNKLKAKAREQRRNVAPVARTHMQEAELRPQDRPRDMPSTGPARIEAAEIETAQDGPGFSERAELLKFLDEECEVVVATTNDQNADPCPGFWVNGRSQYFPRGVRVKCRRLFVEKLARTVTTAYRQEEYLDGKGNRAVRNVPTTSLAFPFTVVYDPNPRGRAWLENILQEA